MSNQNTSSQSSYNTGRQDAFSGKGAGSTQGMNHQNKSAYEAGFKSQQNQSGKK